MSHRWTKGAVSAWRRDERRQEHDGRVCGYGVIGVGVCSRGVRGVERWMHKEEMAELYRAGPERVEVQGRVSEEL